MENTFQVDLRGVVDLLSHHLYGSPRVYVRELLQNGMDAISARRSVEPGAPAVVRLATGGDGSLCVHDTGIGLTEAQVHELLATIGRSSKRDELGFARHEFLGQFGIGLLSCFLVADEITVVTRAGGAPTVRWTGHSSGRYEVRLPEEQRAETGTTVELRARPGEEHWLAESTVRELVELFGSLLPISIEVGTSGSLTTQPPWEDRQRLIPYARRVFGFDPFDAIPLTVPEAGLTGVAYVLPTPTNPSSRAGHRVYLKRMLLGENVAEPLPEWAFFVRCVFDSAELRPTANREALYQDSLLEVAREAIGDQIRGWLVRLAASDPRRMGEFLSVHHLGVKALALHDDEMLRLVEAWWPMETNVGRLSLADFASRYGVLRYCATTDQFRQLAAVAAAQDVVLINGGYTFDADLIERVGRITPGLTVERLDPSDLATRFESLDPATELAALSFLRPAQRAMDQMGCEVVLRSYEPAGLAALYLIDREASFQRDLADTRDQVDDVWSQVLSALAKPGATAPAQLVLNWRNALVRRIAAIGDDNLVATCVQALYGQALLLGHHPLRPVDAALLNRSLLGLLDHAARGVDTDGAL